MVVNVTPEDVGLFESNGYDENKVKATVDHYRGQGLSDDVIQQKLNSRVQELKNLNKPVSPSSPLEQIKNTLKWVAATPFYAYQEGLQNTRQSELETKEMFTPLSNQELSEKYAIEDRPQRNYQTDNFVKKSYVEAFKMLPMILSTLKEGAVGALTGAATGATTALVAGQLGPQIALPEELVTVPAGAIAGAIWGSRIGASKKVFEIEAGGARSEFKNYKDAEGNPIDDTTLNIASTGVGAANAYLELVGLNATLKAFPSGAALLKKLQRDTVKEFLKDETSRNLLKQVAKNYGKSLAIEPTTEMAQEATQIYTGFLIDKLKGSDNSPLENHVARILDAGTSAFGAMLWVGGAGSFVQSTNILMKKGMTKEQAKAEVSQMTPEERHDLVDKNYSLLVEDAKKVNFKDGTEQKTSPFTLQGEIAYDTPINTNEVKAELQDSQNKLIELETQKKELSKSGGDTSSILVEIKNEKEYQKLLNEEINKSLQQTLPENAAVNLVQGRKQQLDTDIRNTDSELEQHMKEADKILKSTASIEKKQEAIISKIQAIQDFEENKKAEKLKAREAKKQEKIDLKEENRLKNIAYSVLAQATGKHSSWLKSQLESPSQKKGTAKRREAILKMVEESEDWRGTSDFQTGWESLFARRDMDELNAASDLAKEALDRILQKDWRKPEDLINERENDYGNWIQSEVEKNIPIIDKLSNNKEITAEEGLKDALEYVSEKTPEETHVWLNERAQNNYDNRVNGKEIKSSEQVYTPNKNLLSKLKKQYKDLEKQKLAHADNQTKVANKYEETSSKRSLLDAERSAILSGETINAKDKVQFTAKQYVAQRIKAVKDTLNQVKQGFKEGVRLTRREIKDIQNTVIGLVKESDMADKDKAKFYVTVRDTNTQEKFEKNIDEIINKINSFEEREKRNTLRRNLFKKIKATKPKTSNNVLKGKYDYTTNRIMKEAYSYLKMTKETAQRNLMATNRYLKNIEEKTEEDLNFTDKFLLSLLSVKALGADASLELITKVNNDFDRIAKEGKEAKDEADLNDRLNKDADIAEALDLFKKSKADAKSIKTKVLNVYRKNIANLHYILSSFGDAKITDKLDAEPAQEKYNQAVFFKKNEVTQKSIEILKAKDSFDFQKRVAELSEEKPEYGLIKLPEKDKNAVMRYLSKFDIMDIYNAIQNEDIKQDYIDNYGETPILNLVSKLSEEETQLADYMADVVRGYEKVINEYNIKKNGIDLPKRANYWPASSEHETDITNLLDVYRMPSSVPSFVKTKVRKAVPVPKNAWSKMQRHIRQAEYISNMDDIHTKLDNIFKDKNVRILIGQKFGKSILEEIDDSIKVLALNQDYIALADWEKFLNKSLGRWAVAKIGNPEVGFKQLTQTLNYTTKMPVGAWTKYYAEGLAHPKKTVKFMMENSHYLQTRFGRGYDDALNLAIKEAETSSKLEQKTTEFLLSFTKTGDIGSIIYGGYPYIKHLQEQGYSLPEAMGMFETLSNKNQQSSNTISLSRLQRGRTTQYFSKFLNTPNQYVRQIIDAQIRFKNGDMSKNEYFKTMSMYLFTQPVLFSLMGSGIKAGKQQITMAMGGDVDNEMDLLTAFTDAMNQIATTFTGAIPILNDLFESTLRVAEGKNAYGAGDAQMIGDAMKSFVSIGRDANKFVSGDDINPYEVLYNFALLLEPAKGIPVAKTVDYANIASGGKVKEAISN